MWTVRQAAQWLGLSEATVRSRINDGTLPHVRLGPRKTMLPVVELVRLFDSDYQPEDAPPRIMTPTEVAEETSLERWSVYYLINSGALPAVKIGERQLLAETRVRAALRPGFA